MPFWDNRPGFAVGLWMPGGFTPSSAPSYISDCLRRYTKLNCNYLAPYHPRRLFLKFIKSGLFL